MAGKVKRKEIKPRTAEARLLAASVGGLASRTLRRCRLFHFTYPGIWQTLSAELHGKLPARSTARKSDNPPVGLLLCTRKDHSLVEYALADLSNGRFVSKYQLELPSREQLQRFLDGEVGEMNHG